VPARSEFFTKPVITVRFQIERTFAAHLNIVCTTGIGAHCDGNDRV